MRAKLIVLAIVSATIVACSHWGTRNVASSNPKRGKATDYDPGPPKITSGESYAKIFADTPNYRAYGQAVIGGSGEKFRWKFGPMWYRGRLGQDEVKIFIIGQEGAQDENVTNRSFTGSTGTKMQKFINHFGVNRSYLYMNTFVYTITGQYSVFGVDCKANPGAKECVDNAALLWLAQNEDSIVVEHRHRLFDFMREQNKNSLALVIGVGTAGKDSAATWANHLDPNSNCSNSKVSRSHCTAKGVTFVGVPHPGAASERNGGSDAASRLTSAFAERASYVLNLIKSNKLKISSDKDARIGSGRYRYGNAPVPYADFAFGSNWRMGESGTSSNRRGSHTIQVFSSNGCYNNAAREGGRCSATKVDNIKYDDPVDGTNKPRMAAGDVPYESPKSGAAIYDFDPGPGEYADVLMSFFLDVDWPSYGVTQHMSFGPQGFYRGTFDNPQVLVIADQFSHDDMFTGRALTGGPGQQLQSKLNSLKKRYLILRTLPVDTLDLSEESRSEIINDPDISAIRDNIYAEVFKNNKNISKIIAVGVHAAGVAEKVARKYGISSLEKIAKPSGRADVIPRADLPSHTRLWMGSSGSRAARGYRMENGSKVYSGDYYKIYAPKWAARWKAGSLTAAERASASKYQR